MDRKIVFFDIDGTILDDNKQIPRSTRKAINQLQQSGVYTAIATGRGPNEMMWVCEALNINSYVAINGSYAVFQGKEIFLENMEQKEVVDLAATVKQNNHSMAFITYNDIWALHQDHPLIKSCLKTLQMQYPRADQNLHTCTPVNQVVIYCEEKDDQIYQDQHPKLKFMRFHKYGMDATPKQSSKAVGIKKIIEAGGFKKENTYAFGDALNDMEMLSYVGYGIAMGNSDPQIKSVADYITTANTKDGIWNACRQLGLLQAKVV